MAQLVHYYHLYSNGSWQDAWEEHITTVIESGLYEELTSIKVGVVGPTVKRLDAIKTVTQHSKVEVILEKDTGFEQETLDVLADDLQASEQELYVLYSHTKGSAYQRAINPWWRRDMIKHTVGRWKEAVTLLDDGYQAVGIYWRRPPMGKGSPVIHHHFSGNYWWARADHLKTLGKPRRGTRYDAEAWIGYDPNIRAMDLHPGTPKVSTVGGRNHNTILDRTFGDGNVITAHVNSRVLGPNGIKLTPGQIIQLSDSPYVQVLLKGGAITQWS